MKKSGFTLIELLVVIVIIGVLASLSIVVLGNIRAKGRDTRRISDIRQVQTALEMYKNDNGVYPTAITSGQALVGPDGQNYMAKVPTAPGVNDGTCTTDTYSYSSSAPYLVYSITYCLGGTVQDAGPTDCIARPGKICSGPVLGESYQGGTVAYIFQSGDTGYVAGQTHGLIAEPSNRGLKAWSNIINASSGATGTAIGTGQANTTAIINQASHTDSSAKICDDLSSGGYTDWYLPAKDELAKFYTNLKVNGIGGFLGAWYWGSSESSDVYAWKQRFDTGGQSFEGKSAQVYVRCCRSF